jgi:iron complex transport system substrate-binding protein
MPAFLPTTSLLCWVLLAAGIQPGGEFTDDLERRITLRSTPRRIVSLAPSITESLFAIGAGHQVVGVTDYCDYPEEVRQKERVGGMTNPGIETIVSLNPDLIILSMEGNVRQDFERLTGLGIPVFVTNPRTLGGIFKSIADIGRLTGRPSSAAAVLGRLRHRADSLAAIARTGTGVRLLFLVSLRPLMVAGGRTFLDELIRLAGGRNLAATSGSGYPTYSRETVVRDAPDVILHMEDEVRDIRTLLGLFPEWKAIPALRTGRVFRINPDLVSRPGPRAVEGLDTLVRILNRER